MASEDGIGPRKRRKINTLGSAPYLLHSLFEDVPLATEHSSDVYITCVEYWNENLYVGTSAAEILHFVCLPPASPDEAAEPTFILASRLPILFAQSPLAGSNQEGVRQIVVLSSVNKACVLCNGTVTFYMLPELSPAFGATKVNNCRWIGGLDLNWDAEEGEDPTIMIAVQNRIMLVQIGDEARRIKKIEFPGCLTAARRGTIACAADTNSYSLLEVAHQQKIPLFPISSSNEVFVSGHVEDMNPAPRTPLKRSPSSSYPTSPTSDASGRGRSTSMNALVGMLSPQAQAAQLDRSPSGTPDPFTSTGESRRSSSEEQEGKGSPKLPSDHEPDNKSPTNDSLKPLSPPPPPAKQSSRRLQPHVVSPTPSEFLLVTGTEETEPGVGMFVDMDGEVVRGTINFHRFPKSVVIDTNELDETFQTSGDGKEEFVLAVIEDEDAGKSRTRLEIQRWDEDPGESERTKSWLEIPSSGETQFTQVGLRHTLSPSHLELNEIGQLLRIVRLKNSTLPPHVSVADSRTQASIEHSQKEKELFDLQELTDSGGSKKSDGSASQGWEAERDAEEAKFAHGLGKVQSSLVMWSGSQIWRVLHNPLIAQLEDTLHRAQETVESEHMVLRRDIIMDLLLSVQDTEPKTEAEFIGLSYVKQKASLMLYGDLLSMQPDSRNAAAIDGTEKALLAGNLDPRLALLFVPLLRCEVLQGPQGIWTHAGLASMVGKYLEQVGKIGVESSGLDASRSPVLNMVKRFLLSWQQKRGYGSITDETNVLDSTDAALLHLTLEQDAYLTRDQRAASPIRPELNRLVDNWKGNFDRAVMLLETYKRLYVLSRLYQSQKMSRNVLKTWRRIVDGETDAGGEVSANGVETQMRRYLVKIKDVQLVEEYGSWLAARNPNLGIQVFADNTSRVRLEPAEVVALLKERAPNAVQVYLEHLVFAKNYTQYADDLISHYLDTVLSVLESSPEARTSLADSYLTYRALRAPKPTYLNFIIENTPTEPWWQSRLRLLQLLGGINSSQFTSNPIPTGISYSIPNVLTRIEPFRNELVSECIILDGLQGHHGPALHLLTHGLGDHDSAIRYCLFGGPRSSPSSTGTPPELADYNLQTTLFRHLLNEFLHIEDLSDRIERTCDLLARFAAWFDVREVLDLVPEDWSVDILGGFFVHVFRTLVSQTRETRIERALSAGLSLRIGAEFIDGMEKVGPWVEEAEGVRRLKDAEPRQVSLPADDPSDEASDDSAEFGETVGPTSGEVGQ
ncbi:TGF beta receptor associated protein 1, putative [Penicillium digitatum]|uniref:TGF beta receptor associated protein 1, putative n=3 Tax=Penicillium digitatum TaxID=36651 RepID=K9GAE0_PEND2|nr:TGF beta receptor associated protein 1, putative [Penicillium digitatum Pd1]EKV08968.1 TGF beta receptor associated protein 1, putative [Penicillium digitatum Pd1]EKV10296.1 TGF beta receptor associated protein 1, putative [Penicillium digitatum PHI26]QQK41903.1 TGF beta receptor associated protein 1, putative [Penicillium digitatum]